MKITQGEIAKRLNLSTATISRALRGDSVINAEVRAEVMAMAAKLGYRAKGKVEQQLRKQTEGQEHQYIGVIVKVPGGQDAWAPDEIAHGYISGMSELSTELNTSLIVHHVTDESVLDLLDLYKQPPMLREKSVSGLILIHYFPPEVAERLANWFPCVSIVHSAPKANMDLIDMDNHYGIEAMVQTLYDNGHRKIGFVGFRPQLTWSQSRLGAYIQSLIRLDLEINREWILGEPDVNSIQEKLTEGVTAWVCSIDSIGYRLCRDLLDRGIRVPDDISLVGFNGIKPLLNCPQLTTAKPPLKVMGGKALRRIHYRIQNPLEQPVRILHRCDVIEGETVKKLKMETAEA